MIPLYNKESYITKSIQSVLSQTISDFELIIVNDGSTDSSLDVVNGITDSRIRIINQENAGVSIARNNGVAAANSDIVAFLDADDEWLPRYLETILSLSEKFPNAGMFGTAFSVYADEKHIHDEIHKQNEGDRLFHSYFCEYMVAKHSIIMTSCFAAKKEALLKVGGYQPHMRIGEDHDLYGKIALSFPVAYSPLVCSICNIGTENNTDKVNYIIDVPLEQYLRENTVSSPLLNSECFTAYMDHWRIRTGGRNIYSGFRKEGRLQIKQVSSRENRLLKFLFLIVSYVPINYSKLPANFVRRVLRICRLSI